MFSSNFDEQTTAQSIVAILPLKPTATLTSSKGLHTLSKNLTGSLSHLILFDLSDYTNLAPTTPPYLSISTEIAPFGSYTFSGKFFCSLFI